MKRIELEASAVDSLRLEGDYKKPDMVRLVASTPAPDRDNTLWQYTYEIPTWRLSDADVSVLRDLSFLEDKTVRIVLEIDE